MRSCMYGVVVTSDEEGGFDASAPDLPGCFSYGDTYEEAVRMAVDAAKTYVASLLKHGDPVPEAHMGDVSSVVWFEVDAGYVTNEGGYVMKSPWLPWRRLALLVEGVR